MYNFLIQTISNAFKIKILIAFINTWVYVVTSVPKNPTATHIKQQYIAIEPVTTNSHAFTLVELKPNVLLAAWFGVKYEGAKDVGIYVSNYKDEKWSSPKCLIQELIREKDTLPC